jgi:hypothetical protein
VPLGFRVEKTQSLEVFNDLGLGNDPALLIWILYNLDGIFVDLVSRVTE